MGRRDGGCLLGLFAGQAQIEEGCGKGGGAPGQGWVTMCSAQYKAASVLAVRPCQWEGCLQILHHQDRELRQKSICQPQGDVSGGIPSPLRHLLPPAARKRGGQRPRTVRGRQSEFKGLLSGSGDDEEGLLDVWFERNKDKYRRK